MEDLSDLSKKEFRKLARKANKKRRKDVAEKLDDSNKWKKLEFGDELLIGGSEGGAYSLNTFIPRIALTALRYLKTHFR
eukprot:1190788-Prorocentrum_minimum.AAC.3